MSFGGESAAGEPAALDDSALIGEHQRPFRALARCSGRGRLGALGVLLFRPGWLRLRCLSLGLSGRLGLACDADRSKTRRGDLEADAAVVLIGPPMGLIALDRDLL